MILNRSSTFYILVFIFYCMFGKITMEQKSETVALIFSFSLHSMGARFPNSSASRIGYLKHFHWELSRNVNAHRPRRIASYFAIGADYLCVR